MKALRAFLIAAAVLAAGCGGDDQPTSPATTGNGSMGAKVNGSNWSATMIIATHSGGIIGIGGTQISGATSKQFNITGPITTPGTYPVGLLTMTRIQYSEGTGTNIKTFIPESGQIVVESVSTSSAKGTFSFEGKEQLGSGQGTATVSVTNGTFDVKF